MELRIWLGYLFNDTLWFSGLLVSKLPFLDIVKSLYCLNGSVIIDVFLPSSAKRYSRGKRYSECECFKDKANSQFKQIIATNCVKATSYNELLNFRHDHPSAIVQSSTLKIYEAILLVGY